MLKNYFKTALRSIRKQGVFAGMNIIGLATGIACFVLISLFVRDELTFDRFHENTDRIYRGMTAYNAGFVAGIADYLVQHMEERMPEVEAAARINFGTRAVMEYEGKLIFEDEYYKADPELFQIFDFSLMYGNEDEALRDERSIVISQYIMNKYFGGENPVGEFLKMGNEEESYLVTGVLNEIPSNSRFQFNFIGKLSTADFSEPRMKWYPSGILYVMTAPGTDLSQLQSGINELAAELDFPGSDQSEFLIEPYGDLYLKSRYSFTSSGVSGDMKFIWIFGAIGIILLVIACINYINSATARSLNRNKEIGVRRTIGATGKQIRYQFLAETFCTTFLAVLVSAGLVEVLIPVLNGLADKSLSMNYFSDPYTLPFLLLMVPMVTFLAGIYPAFFSSRIGALDLFKRNTNTGKGYLRHSLVIFQFVITLTLIFCTQIILNQVQQLQDTEVGLNPDSIIKPRMAYGSDYELFKNTFSKVAGVESVTSTPFPYTSGSRLDVWYTHEGQRDSVSLSYYRTQANAPQLYQMNILKGEAFDPSNELHGNQVLISQSLANMLPFDNPLGEQLIVRDDEYAKSPRTIIGVYEDPNFNAKSSTFPTVMVTSKKLYNIDLKLAAEDQEGTLARVREAYKEIVPDTPFEYTFVHDQVMANYRTVSDFGTIFKYFAGIAVIIAALGLIGLSSFTVVQKYKEIGIRKVLGATVSRITLNLLKRYMALVLIATILATPLAYLLMDNWLSDFASRISISVAVFLLGFAMAVVILLVTVGYQTLRAALLNPVMILKDE